METRKGIRYALIFASGLSGAGTAGCGDEKTTPHDLSGTTPVEAVKKQQEQDRTGEQVKEIGRLLLGQRKQASSQIESTRPDTYSLTLTWPRGRSCKSKPTPRRIDKVIAFMTDTNTSQDAETTYYVAAESSLCIKGGGQTHSIPEFNGEVFYNRPEWIANNKLDNRYGLSDPKVVLGYASQIAAVAERVVLKTPG